MGERNTKGGVWGQRQRAAGSSAPACSADVMSGRAAELMNLARFADDNGLGACGRALRNIAGAFADKEAAVRKQNATHQPERDAIG